MRIHVDRSVTTWLPLCECGWRGMPELSHMAALESARRHEACAHPGDKQALRALANAEWRAAQTR